ncbi:hypothetical protein RIF29_35618 [Crotalaria pallida]|uniref:Transcriptional factor DELLA N-terminal domain-containing protein n=1 Tax=Crotalaria pallida TaxID=3830 RepID=A0AAN9HRT9_CROPI
MNTVRPRLILRHLLRKETLLISSICLKLRPAGAGLEPPPSEAPNGGLPGGRNVVETERISKRSWKLRAAAKSSSIYSMTTSVGKSKLWEEEESVGAGCGGGMDELLAVVGYKVRLSDMADVAHKIEQLEEVMTKVDGE